MEKLSCVEKNRMEKLSCAYISIQPINYPIPLQIINIPIDLIDSVLFVNIGNKKFNSNGQEYKTIAPPANIKLPYRENMGEIYDKLLTSKT